MCLISSFTLTMGRCTGLIVPTYTTFTSLQVASASYPSIAFAMPNFTAKSLADLRVLKRRF